jgi:hypothetical protein
MKEMNRLSISPEMADRAPSIEVLSRSEEMTGSMHLYSAGYIACLNKTMNELEGCSGLI